MSDYFEEKAREHLLASGFTCEDIHTTIARVVASFGRLCAVEIAERAVLRARNDGIAESPREVVAAVVDGLEKEGGRG